MDRVALAVLPVVSQPEAKHQVSAKNTLDQSRRDVRKSEHLSFRCQLLEELLDKHTFGGFF